jgi:predicted ArsR family transcriptional regulator
VERDVERERVTVQEAARRLGITESAVRKRIQRGLVDHDKEPDGRVYIYVDTPDDVRDTFSDNSYPLIVERLENEVEFLRRELERRDHLLAAALERIPPQIEAPRETPSEAPEARVTPSEPVPNTETPPEAERTPWWRRLWEG